LVFPQIRQSFALCTAKFYAAAGGADAGSADAEHA
jgi:hypothetical protein